MKNLKSIIVFVLVIAFASAALGNVNEDLLKAVKNSEITSQQVQKFIKSGADVNFRNEDGWTVLMFASRY